MAQGLGQGVMALPPFAEMVATLADLPTWEDKYGYVIELGQNLPPMLEALKTDGALVRGCTSRVWMVAGFGEEGTLNLLLDSDAVIVRGLLALVHAAAAGRTRAELAALDIEAALAPTGLFQNLSPNRRNGLASVIARLKEI